MPVRHAEAVWDGELDTGDGWVSVESGAVDSAYSFRSRFGDETLRTQQVEPDDLSTSDRTNPEELIGAAHASCFSMLLAQLIEDHGYSPDTIETHADVTLETDADDDPVITQIDLYTDAEVPGLDEEQFQELIEEARDACPVSQALGGVTIDVDGMLR